jgi:hypothetical protein
VLEYSSILIDTISPSFIKKLDAVQNNSLRAIFQKHWEEKIPIEQLREKAGIESVEERLKKLNERFFEKAMCAGNPFMEQLIDDYLEFRNRKKINPNKAIDDERLRLDIENYNKDQENTKEEHPTMLCKIEAVKDMRSDTYPP